VKIHPASFSLCSYERTKARSEIAGCKFTDHTDRTDRDEPAHLASLPQRLGLHVAPSHHRTCADGVTGQDRAVSPEFSRSPSRDRMHGSRPVTQNWPLVRSVLGRWVSGAQPGKRIRGLRNGSRPRPAGLRRLTRAWRRATEPNVRSFWVGSVDRNSEGTRGTA
jgi:hypothetical protein